MSATPTGPTLIFDIETDDIVERKVTKLHVICIRELGVEGVSRYRYADRNKALERLTSSAVLVGHNIQGFDLQALHKLFGWSPSRGTQIYDTLLMCRLAWPDIKESDFRRYAKGELPGHLIGRHSLEAWGYRIGVRKGDFKKNNSFKEWSQEMEDYCAQDVEVTATLYQRLLAKNLSPESVKLEHDFAAIIDEQMDRGFQFNSAKAGALYATLMARRNELESQLRNIFPPTIITMKMRNWVAGGVVYPTKSAAVADGHKLKNITPGDRKTKTIPFNPGSRDEIAERLIAKYGWKPVEFTDTNKPKVDDDILSALDYPEAKMLAEFLMVDKRLGQLADGKQGLIKSVGSDGRIHGRVVTNGAVTGRCTHMEPNMAQIPRVGSPYGTEFRSLLEVPAGFELVGADASGLELRCLAHFMAKYDGGEYCKVILHGDVHTTNKEAAGLTDRNQAKTFIYAFLYGAGDEKLGSIVEPMATPERQAQIGAALKRKFLKSLPALKMLKEAVGNAAEERGFIYGLDKRIIPIRSKHAALNTLLQGAGAIIMKMATVIAVRDMRAGGISKADACLVAHIHDEFQTECREGLGKVVGPIATAAITKAGEHFGFRCPLAGEFRIGKNWADTH